MLINQTSEMIQVIDSNITSFNITNLDYWTSYNICVSGFTTIGKGEENCTIEITAEYRKCVIMVPLLIPITRQSVNGSVIPYHRVCN